MRITVFYTLASLVALGAATPMPKEQLNYDDWKLCNIESQEFKTCAEKIAKEACHGTGPEAAADEVCTGTIKYRCCKLLFHNSRMITAVADNLIASDLQCKYPTKHNVLGEVIKGLEDEQ